MQRIIRRDGAGRRGEEGEKRQTNHRSMIEGRGGWMKKMKEEERRDKWRERQKQKGRGDRVKLAWIDRWIGLDWMNV